MHVDLWIQQAQFDVLAWWKSLGPDGLYYVWLVGGVLFFVAWAWWSHRFIRKLLGHSRFRGSWYNAEQMEVLVKMIDEDNAKGLRVMKHDEMRLLRTWRFGREGIGMDRGAGYF